MSNELIVGATYKARRTEPIGVKVSESGALMVYVSYALTDVAFTGVQKVCYGQRDGTKSEKNIENLHKAFPEWKSNNPLELEEIPLQEGNEPEFQLANWHNDPYEKNGVMVDSWQFSWINALGSGYQSTPEERDKIMALWGAKFGAPSAAATTKPAKSKPAKAPVVEAEVVQPAVVKPAVPARKPAPVVAAKSARVSSAEEVMELLIKKYHNGEATEDQQQALGDDYYYPAQDKLFGNGVGAESPEQWGQVADALGL